MSLQTSFWDNKIIKSLNTRQIFEIELMPVTDRIKIIILIEIVSSVPRFQQTDSKKRLNCDFLYLITLSGKFNTHSENNRNPWKMISWAVSADYQEK